MTSANVLFRDRTFPCDHFLSRELFSLVSFIERPALCFAFVLVTWQQKLHADATKGEREARANSVRSDPGSTPLFPFLFLLSARVPRYHIEGEEKKLACLSAGEKLDRPRCVSIAVRKGKIRIGSLFSCLAFRSRAVP